MDDEDDEIEMMLDKPEPTDPTIWYIGSDGVEAEERRRVYAMFLAFRHTQEGDSKLVPLARSIELFLMGGMNVEVVGVNVSDLKIGLH